MEKHILIDRSEAVKRFRPIAKDSHKGLQGHALIVGGSYGKMGSVCLSAKACLKSGAGLVTAYIPKCGYDVVQSVVPEAMVLTDDYNEHITSVNHKLSLQAIGFGMGMGQDLDTHQAMFHFLKMNSVPLVIDADGLNILSENKEWLEILPKQTILTPHVKELERLIGHWDSKLEMLENVKTFAAKYDVIVVVKGAPTLIVSKNVIYENTTGNQALATAGSGDVLTGIITGLSAQHYAPADAAILGVYVHGLTADLAVPETGHHAFIASDIIHYLGKAFLTLEQ
ncbi:NAD(P)H-hydrate dehydratase [Flavobacterium suncheonense]|uniref:ADP-dependent (S)-NAD(P)H-hydrate dehydratase n=1 Tax=Flavobacterium suncheonense GH29-5 = DSM 17707 TaxID=1121899 RepID=A0A0A2MEP5_9FLAO|nr:NAD(P)H-hydrate dehydratase [Flavobacterium suncheonense]KGO89928.1 ADP-dependent (S)-NAD(P)H-hydrate dehydratase [Flavobacterium suncheonense GH29-5 = DSM 17707]